MEGGKLKKFVTGTVSSLKTPRTNKQTNKNFLIMVSWDIGYQISLTGIMSSNAVKEAKNFRSQEKFKFMNVFMITILHVFIVTQ